MFEKNPDPQIETLKTQIGELVSINRALLKKLEEQHTMLGSIAAFVRKQSGDVAAFGVIR